MRLGLLSLILLILLFSCKKEDKSPKKELLIYCDITMVKPMSQVCQEFEKSHPGIKITLIQGGSQDLYNSLKKSRQGDLYLAGSDSYRKQNISEGLLGESLFLGHNQAAIVVKKGNPKGFTGDLNELATTNYSVVICSPASGSIGRMSKKILTKKGIFEKVIENTAFLATDSRNLTKAIKEGTADIVINWKATVLWPENSREVEMLPISEEFAPKKHLVLNSLTFSTEKELVKEFFYFAGSERGKAIFTEYGF